MTREEIYACYAEEFLRYLDDLPEFITASGPKQYAVAFRESHPVRKDEVPAKDFIRRDTWQTDASGDQTTPEFDDFKNVVEFILHPARNDPLGRSKFALVDPEVPEQLDLRPDAVYYALDHWERPWVLLVDINAKEIARDRADEMVSAAVDGQDDNALLGAAGILDAAPKGYLYAFEDIDRAIEYGFEVRDISKDDLDTEEAMVVYSGQEVHVYPLDIDPAHRYDEQSPEVLNDLLPETYDIPIDPVVTADGRRVARLPHSLHADICSTVQPIESLTFDVRSAARRYR